MLLYVALFATVFSKSSTDDTRKVSDAERLDGIAALGVAISDVALKFCNDAPPLCQLIEGSMMLSTGCDDIWDCLKDKSKDNTSSSLKKRICKPASALIDNLNDSGYAGGKGSNSSNAVKAADKNKGGFNNAAISEAGLKTNSKGKISQKSTDKLGEFFYDAYECKTKPGSSANDSHGKYGRRLAARTYILN